MNMGVCRNNYRPQGNVFTPVCHSVYRGEGSAQPPLDAEPPDSEPPPPPMYTPPPPLDENPSPDTVNKREVCILLECILVLNLVLLDPLLKSRSYYFLIQ